MSALIKSSLLLSGALLLGRLFGFVREILLAARLGVSEGADIAIVALTLPDYLVGLVFSGGFTAAMVPALRKLEGPGRDRLFRFAASWSVLAALVLAALVAGFPGQIFAWLAPGLSPEQTAPWAWTLRVIALSVPLATLSGMLGAYLNVRGIFFAVGLGIAIYNIVLVLALLPGGDASAVITRLAFGVLAAGAARLAFLLFMARPPAAPLFTAPEGADARLGRLFAAGVLAVGVIFLANIWFRTIAAASGDGALAAFAYALRLFELPMGILLAPIATVLLPRLSAAAPEPRLLRRAAAALLGLALAVLAIGFAAGEPVARLIYFRGAMTEAGMAEIVATAYWMFAALPFAALSLLATTLLNAERRTGVVFTNAALALAAGGGLALAAPGWLLPGFVLFHGLNAALNVIRSGLWRAALGRH